MGQLGIMRLVSWNVRGLGNLRTVLRLRHSLKDVNPSIIFLMKTKLQSKWMKGVCRFCGFSYGIDVLLIGSSGGLSSGWKKGFFITFRSFSQSHIDIVVNEDTEGIS